MSDLDALLNDRTLYERWRDFENRGGWTPLALSQLMLGHYCSAHGVWSLYDEG